MSRTSAAARESESESEEEHAPSEVCACMMALDT